MARKTLNKMEFAQLIDTLKEQNQGQLEAQQQTTKSIRNLQAYFLKQDRADANPYGSRPFKRQNYINKFLTLTENIVLSVLISLPSPRLTANEAKS